MQSMVFQWCNQCCLMLNGDKTMIWLHIAAYGDAMSRITFVSSGCATAATFAPILWHMCRIQLPIFKNIFGSAVPVTCQRLSNITFLQAIGLCSWLIWIWIVEALVISDTCQTAVHWARTFSFDSGPIALQPRRRWKHLATRAQCEKYGASVKFGSYGFAWK